MGVGLRQGFILSPSARTGPSRLGPAGEGRSDSGVLHHHPRGQARYPEGGRRREDEPPGKECAFAQHRRRRAPGPRAPAGLSTPGLPPRTPRRMDCRPRCFNPSLPTRHAAGSSLHQRGGTPHPVIVVVSMPLAPVMGGLSRSLTETSRRRSSPCGGRIVQFPRLIVRVRCRHHPVSSLASQRRRTPFSRL